MRSHLHIGSQHISQEMCAQVDVDRMQDDRTVTSMIPASVRVRREDASSSSRVVAGTGGVKGRPTVGPGFGLAPTLSTSRLALHLLLLICGMLRH